MPQMTRTQLVLFEIAAACILGGIVLKGAGEIVGFAVAVVVLLLALAPMNRRWLYQVALSRLGLQSRRRRGRNLTGLAGVLGTYNVESVSGGSRGSDLGVVHSDTTWCLPLMIGLDGLLNDDVAVPVRALTELLRVEDVELSSVRLITLTAPAQARKSAPGGPRPPMVQLAARYCLLTLDTRRAAPAIAARGGTEAAVHQILRRCAVHAQQELAGVGLVVRRLNHAAVESLFTTWMGPASAPNTRSADRASESWVDVRVAGTWSTVFAVTGDGADIIDRVSRLVEAAPTPVVTTALLLRPVGNETKIEATMLVRLSSPETRPHAAAARSLDLLAQAFDLRVQRLDGEQGTLLRATSPVGVGERS